MIINYKLRENIKYIIMAMYMIMIVSWKAGLKIYIQYVLQK